MFQFPSFKISLILRTDGYKLSHWVQYPFRTEGMFSYLENRFGGKYPASLFVGFQIINQLYLTQTVTREDVEEARRFFEAGYSEYFNYEGWMYIVEKHGGKLPVRIKAVAEGTVVPEGNILMSIESLDPKCFWVVGHLETMLMRVWYPITVGTKSYSIKKLIMRFLMETSNDPWGEIPYKLVDFGARGATCGEAACIGGAAHMANFKVSDTIEGVYTAHKLYNHPAPASTIPAAEHSTITVWGKEREAEAYRNMLKQFAKPGKLVAIVSDSYDIDHATKNIWGKELKQEVIDSGATIIVRPDSGHPATVVLQCLKNLAEAFGTHFNDKMYKVLNHNVRIIQGDGIEEESIHEILTAMKANNFSATNVTFGMGGGLLQLVNRDTQRFAIKCSEAKVDGVSVEVFKDPVTDKGKRSKKGRIDLRYHLGKFETVPGDNLPGSLLELVFEMGEVKKTYTLDEVRNRTDAFLKASLSA